MAQTTGAGTTTSFNWGHQLGRISSAFLLRGLAPEYTRWQRKKAFSGSKPSLAALSVPIRDDPEMVVKVELLGVGAGLQP